MTREAVRTMKRAVVAGGRRAADSDTVIRGRSCALSLLDRSIAFGHGRLAIIRLSIAVGAGAELTSAHWLYCCQAARASRDPSLQKLYASAAEHALVRSAGEVGAH